MFQWNLALKVEEQEKQTWLDRQIAMIENTRRPLFSPLTCAFLRFCSDETIYEATQHICPRTIGLYLTARPLRFYASSFLKTKKKTKQNKCKTYFNCRSFPIIKKLCL